MNVQEGRLSPVAREQLLQLERRYETRLRAVLHAVIGTGVVGSGRRVHDDAVLLEHGAEIDEMRRYFGLDTYALHERLLELRALRGTAASNDLHLMKRLLADLERNG